MEGRWVLDGLQSLGVAGVMSLDAHTPSSASFHPPPGAKSRNWMNFTFPLLMGTLVYSATYDWPFPALVLNPVGPLNSRLTQILPQYLSLHVLSIFLCICSSHQLQSKPGHAVLWSLQWAQ